MIALSRATSTAALLAAAVWLGGLVSLGAIVAPVVFSTVAMPDSADAMIIVFRRFDVVAMSCAVIVLASEATRALARMPFGPADRIRAGASALASLLAVVEGASISPRIAALHAGGALRGLGDAGSHLARLHDVAEWCAKAEVVLLIGVVVAHVVALGSPRERLSGEGPRKTN
jgi:hypothetical protein